jgi:hypothetical protein
MIFNTPEQLMRSLILLTVFVLNAGCTTLHPIEGTPMELQERIASNELLKIGDRVAIVTTDGKTHRFAVVGFGAGIIKGKAESVSIDQVRHVGKRTFSRGKTIALVAGIVVAGTVLGFVIYGTTHLSAGFALR